jgi:hypothetical protein
MHSRDHSESTPANRALADTDRDAAIGIYHGL